MTTAQIEDRLAALELQFAELRGAARSATGPGPQADWWNKIAGTFAANPRFDRAMRLGRQTGTAGKRTRKARAAKRRAAKGSFSIRMP